MGRQDAKDNGLGNSVLRCIERLCAQNAMERSQAQHALKGAEETMKRETAADVRPLDRVPSDEAETNRLSEQIIAQLDALNQKLAAANRELRRYETRVFACERTIYALRQENAELTALCKQARRGETLPPEPQPQESVLDKPGLLVVRFTPDGGEQAEQLSVEAIPFFDEGRPPRPKPFQEPKTPLEHLTVQLLTQFDRMMSQGT